MKPARSFSSKPTEKFWLQFAGLYCYVNASHGMKAIIDKYFCGTYVSTSSNRKKSQTKNAELSIRLKPAEGNTTGVTVTHNKLLYSMTITGSPHFYYPLLTNVLQRIFMVLWYDAGGMVFHASAVESQGKAHVFVGDSGKGKTTVARLSRHLYGLPVLADNQVFVSGQDYLVYPFPFSQFHKDGSNVSLPIASFYILHKASSFAVKSLSFIEGLRALTKEIQLLNANDVSSGTQVSPALRRTIFQFAKTVPIKLDIFKENLNRGLWETINTS